MPTFEHLLGRYEFGHPSIIVHVQPILRRSLVLELSGHTRALLVPLLIAAAGATMTAQAIDSRSIYSTHGGFDEKPTGLRLARFAQGANAAQRCAVARVNGLASAGRREVILSARNAADDGNGGAAGVLKHSRRLAGGRAGRLGRR